jgi:hypothetical protein
MKNTNNKMFTFRFSFDNNGRPDEIEFCASTQKEAIYLFNDWCRTQNNMDKLPDVSNIDIVYNQYDADEYGNDYGKPEEYAE